MKRTKKQRTIQYALYAAVIALTALLQNVSGLFPEIGGARCFLLVPVCVLLGINEEERTAAVLGLFGGFLWDAVCARHLGFNCIYLMLVCYIASALVSFLFRNTFLTGFISASVAGALYCLLYWLLFILPSSPQGAGWMLVRFYIPCAVYTVALTPLIEALLLALKSKITGVRQLDG